MKNLIFSQCHNKVKVVASGIEPQDVDVLLHIVTHYSMCLYEFVFVSWGLFPNIVTLILPFRKEKNNVSPLFTFCDPVCDYRYDKSRYSHNKLAEDPGK